MYNTSNGIICFIMLTYTQTKALHAQQHIWYHFNGCNMFCSDLCFKL